MSGALNHKKSLARAKVEADRLFGDTSVNRATTRAELTSLRDHVDSLLGMLPPEENVRELNYQRKRL